MFRYIERPIYCERDWYDEALEIISSRLSEQPGVKAVYRFGNITVPGVSDLDILVVFENDAKSSLNGMEGLWERHTRLFTHGIMAIREDQFYSNMRYTIWSEPVLLKGSAPEGNVPERTPEEEAAIKLQTGLEFLLAHYIDMAVQTEYRIFKLRAFLQHTKGLIMDLEFIGMPDSPIHPLVKEIREKSLHWFEKAVDNQFFDDWIIRFNKAYNTLCREIFNDHQVYLPGDGSYAIAKNIRLINQSTLAYHRKGILIPDIGLLKEKKYFKLLNKFNRFTIDAPITNSPFHPILRDRFLFLREMKSHNRFNLPNFMTMTTAVTSKLL